MTTLIAFRTVDVDGDIWCERCFVFNTESEVKEFFAPNNPKLIKVFTDREFADQEEEVDSNLYDFEIEQVGGMVTCIIFRTQYSGEVRIYRMAGGYIPSLPF